MRVIWYTVFGAGPSPFDVQGLGANSLTLEEYRHYGSGSAARLAWHRCA